MVNIANISQHIIKSITALHATSTRETPSKDMRQVQEKHQAKKKKLYYAFVDLEKAMGFAEAGCG